MAEYIVRIIGYGLLLFVNGMIYYFLHSQFYFLVLVLMVAGPILSAMSVWVLRHYLQVEIHHAQDSYGVQGETAYFTIQIKNPTWFVSLDTKLIVNVENTLMETIGQQVFSVPVHAGKGYTLTLPVVATYPGLLKISVSRVYIKDLMGFFRLKKNVEQTAELSILPRAVTDIAYEKSALEQGMLESEESSKRGNDFSDVQEVREYIPGDKLMSIHWKLSAKRDILMVKDRVSMSDHQLVIVPELFIDQPVNLAAILTMTYSVILELIQEQTTVRLLYWSTNRYEYEDVRIDYKEELDAAFARLYYEKAYKNPSEAADHMALVHPEMHVYLHVFSDGQGAQMQVRENE